MHRRPRAVVRAAAPRAPAVRAQHAHSTGSIGSSRVASISIRRAARALPRSPLPYDDHEVIRAEGAITDETSLCQPLADRFAVLEHHESRARHHIGVRGMLCQPQTNTRATACLALAGARSAIDGHVASWSPRRVTRPRDLSRTSATRRVHTAASRFRRSCVRPGRIARSARLLA